MKVKIKLESWFTNSHNLSERMKRQFVFDSDFEHFEFVDKNPDYTIIFGGTDWDNLESPKNRTFFFSQEPCWTPNEKHNDIHNYCEKVFVADKSFYPDREEYVEGLLPMFYAGRDEFSYIEEWNFSKNMFGTTFDKKYNLSSILTNSYQSHWWYLSDSEKSRIIYKERVDITNFLGKKYEDLIVWGTLQPIQNNFKGEIWNKLAVLKDYRFQLVFENTIQKNYLSEKFWDCILTDTVPVYFGCKNVDDYIEKDTFINLTSYIDNLDEISERIKEILDDAPNLYNRYLPKIRNLKKSFKEDKTFNLWEKIKHTIKSN